MLGFGRLNVVEMKLKAQPSSLSYFAHAWCLMHACHVSPLLFFINKSGKKIDKVQHSYSIDGYIQASKPVLFVNYMKNRV